MLLFVDKSKFNTSLLYTFSTFYELIDNGVYMFTAIYYDSFGHGFYGLSGWEGKSATSSMVTKYDTYINGTKVKVSSSSIINTLNFTYFFIAFKDCPILYPYFTDSSRNACTSQCPTNYIQSPTSKICAQCTSPCINC